MEAAHGAGSVDIRVDQAPDHLVFEVLSLERWTGSDPVERHVAFGEFWHMAGFANVAENPPAGSSRARMALRDPPSRQRRGA